GRSHNTGAGFASTYQNAAALYASFQATEKLSLHARGEYFWQKTILESDGLPSKVLALTGTVQYDLWKNVLSRLEVRWDHSANGTLAYGGTVPGTPNKKNAYELIANVSYKF